MSDLQSLLDILDDEKEFGIPVPLETVSEPIEAKAIVAKCVICHTNQVQTVNFPCMHACFCIVCASPAVRHSHTCPNCRTDYLHVSVLYLTYTDAIEDDLKVTTLDVTKKRKID